MTKNQKEHIMLNVKKKKMQMRCMITYNAQLSNKWYTNKKYQFLN